MTFNTPDKPDKGILCTQEMEKNRNIYRKHTGVVWDKYYTLVSIHDRNYQIQYVMYQST